MKYLVVHTDPRLHPPSQGQLDLLHELDAEMEARDCYTSEDVVSLAGEADVVIAPAAPVSAAMIGRLGRCRLIAKMGTGYDNIDAAAAGRAGIFVTNVPEFCTADVADHTIGLLLDSVRKISRSDREVRNGLWNPAGVLPTSRLEHKILGLVGYGKIARAVVQRALGFGLRILAYDPYVPGEAMQTDKVEACEDLGSLLSIADVVSLHVPLTDHTRHIIGERELDLMKPDAVFINCARGALVDEPALVRALAEGKIAGAGLDVLAKEPPDEDHPLLAMENVVVTPHSAAFSNDAMRDLRRQVYEEVARVLCGETPQNIVNREWLP